MSKDTARQIERMVQSLVRNEISRTGNANQAPAPALASKAGVAGGVVAARDKIQPSQQKEGEAGFKGPLTQTGPIEVYDPVIETDSAGILTVIESPIKSVTMRTADAVPKEYKFIYSDVVRPA